MDIIKLIEKDIFDIEVYTLDLIDDIVMISYHEKHCTCSVKIKQDGKNHNIYLKSKPDAFSRKQNETTKDHEIGEIIEFVKSCQIMENKTYFS